MSNTYKICSTQITMTSTTILVTQTNIFVLICVLLSSQHALALTINQELTSLHVKFRWNPLDISCIANRFDRYDSAADLFSKLCYLLAEIK